MQTEVTQQEQYTDEKLAQLTLELNALLSEVKEQSRNAKVAI